MLNSPRSAMGWVVSSHGHRGDRPVTTRPPSRPSAASRQLLTVASVGFLAVYTRSAQELRQVYPACPPSSPSRLRQASQRASAISGISGVGANPSSAAQERRRRRRRSRSRDRASRARPPRGVRSCACAAALRSRWPSGRRLPRTRGGGVALAGFRRAPNAVPLRSAVAHEGARRERFVRMATARSRSPARASASASMIFKSPLKFRTF